MSNVYLYGIENEFSTGHHYETRDLFEIYCRESSIPYGIGGWNYKPDNSIHTDEVLNGKRIMCGGELVSPIIVGEQAIENMKSAMEFFSTFEMESDDNCAAHLHVGAHIFRNNLNAYKKLILFWMENERELFFLTNEGNQHIKPNMAKFCKPLFLSLYDRVDDILAFEGSAKDFINEFLPEREMCLNLQNAANNPQKNTAEVRMIKPTTNGETWENYMALFFYSFDYAIEMSGGELRDTIGRIHEIRKEGIVTNGEITPENVETYFKSTNAENAKELLSKIGMNSNQFEFLSVKKE